MESIKFSKFHGFGNDYIVIAHEEVGWLHDLGEFSKRICHRNLGVGGDGIAVLQKLETEADYECRIINPDGSEAGFSGNGTRCAVAFLYYENLFTELNLKLKTKSGVKNYQFLKREDNTFWFLAELGTPKEIKNEKLKVKNVEFSVVTLDVGNPVCVFFVKDFEMLDWREIGKETESHSYFPNRTNVVFVKPVDKNNIEIRIWERGAGETSSSGTCSIAAAVASNFAGKSSRNVSVHAEGGTTEAVWREDGEMMITGRADLVFKGEYFFEF